MKKQIIMALAVAFTMTACEKTLTAGNEQVVDDTVVNQPTKKFTFTLKGDFSTQWTGTTRGYLSADGKDLTDVWVLDYLNGTLVQQLHQDDNTAEDFGKPVLNLAYGSHHVYIIASRGTTPTLNTTNHTISFAKVLDTFYKDYEVSVVSTSNGNRAVTLDRIVTRLRLTFEDAVADGTATINITPSSWYYGWDYVAGIPADHHSSPTSTINIPSENIGQTNLQVNLFGFSTATEWTTDISVNSKTSGNAVIGSATLTDVPFKSNRISELSGPLFSAGGVMTLSLNSTWDTAYEGTW